MRRSLARIQGFGFIVWHARHMIYHMLIGLAWAWFLREKWNELNIKWVLVALFGSILPDFEHLVYFFTYGKKDQYTRNLLKILREHQWRVATVFVEKGHKHNTKLRFHSMYIIALLFIFSSVCFFYDWNVWVVLFGAMIFHYIFDICDDLATIGHINPNWKRI
jgi:hypothetical protein